MHTLVKIMFKQQFIRKRVCGHKIFIQQKVKAMNTKVKVEHDIKTTTQRLKAYYT